MDDKIKIDLSITEEQPETKKNTLPRESTAFIKASIVDCFRSARNSLTLILPSK